MKRLIAAVIIIAFSIAFSVFSYNCVDKTLSEISYTVNKDYQQGYALWQSKKKYLSLILKHDDIDSVDEEMYAMMQFVLIDRTEDAQDCKIRIDGYIESIKQGEKLSPENIF